jgi:hypothetical protein
MKRQVLCSDIFKMQSRCPSYAEGGELCVAQLASRSEAVEGKRGEYLVEVALRGLDEDTTVKRIW